jgi:hypothetical protein
MTFQPYPTRANFILLGLAMLAGLVAVALLNLLPRQSELSHIFGLIVGILLMLGLMGLALYWSVVAAKLRYELNRNGLTIQWGAAQQLVPFESIQQIIPGRALSTPPAFVGLNLAGLRLGWGKMADFGKLKFHTTAPPTESLFVVTPVQTYVISPSQPDQFLQAWQARQTLGPTQKWVSEIQWNWPLNNPLLTDPLTWWLLGLAFVACLALFGYFSFTFAQLPRSLPIHFNSFGVPDRIADKSTLFNLPTVGLLVLVINTGLGILVYRWEKVGAYLLWGSALTLQICLWVAAITLTA